VGDGPCIRPPNILRSSVVGCARKYEQSKKRCHKGIFFSEIVVFLVRKGSYRPTTFNTLKVRKIWEKKGKMVNMRLFHDAVISEIIYASNKAHIDIYTKHIMANVRLHFTCTYMLFSSKHYDACVFREQELQYS